jgi:hypothetical protein
VWFLFFLTEHSPTHIGAISFLKFDEPSKRFYHFLHGEALSLFLALSLSLQI